MRNQMLVMAVATAMLAGCGAEPEPPSPEREASMPEAGACPSRRPRVATSSCVDRDRSRPTLSDTSPLVGEGGMGQVYQATATKLQRQVTLTVTSSMPRQRVHWSR